MESNQYDENQAFAQPQEEILREEEENIKNIMMLLNLESNIEDEEMTFKNLKEAFIYYLEKKQDIGLKMTGELKLEYMFRIEQLCHLLNLQIKEYLSEIPTLTDEDLVELLQKKYSELLSDLDHMVFFFIKHDSKFVVHNLIDSVEHFLKERRESIDENDPEYEKPGNIVDNIREMEHIKIIFLATSFKQNVMDELNYFYSFNHFQFRRGRNLQSQSSQDQRESQEDQDSQQNERATPVSSSSSQKKRTSQQFEEEEKKYYDKPNQEKSKRKPSQTLQPSPNYGRSEDEDQITPQGNDDRMKNVQTQKKDK